MQNHKEPDNGELLKYIQDEEVLAEAKQWIQRINEEDSMEARYQLARCCDKKIKNPALNEEIFLLYGMAAIAGHREAQYQTGNCYERGIGIERNISRAAEWYKAAAEQGSADAQYNLAQLFYYERDALSLYWMRQAALQNDVNALLRLGEYYDEGIGVAADCARAEEYYEKAAELGSRAAKKKLLTIRKMFRRLWALSILQV